MNIRVKRIFEPASGEDGIRILVDRLWPRGLSRQKAAIDHWFKSLAPSDELRKWYGHDPRRWNGFRQRYFRELEEKPGTVAELARMAEEDTLSLLYACRESRRNNAHVLKDYLLSYRARSQ